MLHPNVMHEGEEKNLVMNQNVDPLLDLCDI